MEDFASVIWIVIIVGAMIFNVVSQSRKARGKGGHAPQHGEAWPSSAAQTPESAPRPALRPELQPVTPAFPDECQSLEEIPAQGESFDPNVHNAVMHMEDEALGENTVVEVFQAGFKMGEKVIRHAMVKVAN